MLTEALPHAVMQNLPDSVRLNAERVSRHTETLSEPLPVLDLGAFLFPIELSYQLATARLQPLEA